MTEQELQSLGFNKVCVPVEESGDAKNYYYYSLSLSGDAILISDANDEIINDDLDDHLSEDNNPNNLQQTNITDLNNFDHNNSIIFGNCSFIEEANMVPNILER